jgi:hypothetical protein
VAAMLSSNGFGGNYRYGKRVDARNKRLFEVDFAYMKHPKESKSYSVTGSRFVYGKKNLAFNTRLAYGRQHEMFSKHDAGGIAIRYFYSYGPAIVLLKPIYYTIGRIYPIYAYNPPEIVGYDIERLDKPEKFDPAKYLNDTTILSRASFFKGFNELSISPGVFGKFGFNFEYSKEDKIIHALECGVIVEGFLRKIDIMDLRDASGQNQSGANRQLFLTLFVSYRFGRIVDPYAPRKKREKSQEISY